MKILLFGKNGQLGSKLSASLKIFGKLVSLGRGECDLTQTEKVSKVITENHPDIIVNASAYTAVDQAEIDSRTAFQVNSEAVREIAASAQKINSWLIHYSTDYVFNGNKTSPYTENDSTNPMGVYGRSKCKGEEYVMEECTKYILLRTSWVYSEHGNNFPKTILKLASEREELKIVQDQVGSPTYTQFIDRATVQIIEKIIKGKSIKEKTLEEKVHQLSGIYHIASRGHCSWWEFAQFLLKDAQHKGLSFKCTGGKVHPILSSDYATTARRPLYSVLDTTKLKNTFDIQIPHWQESASHFITNYMVCYEA